MIRDLVSKFNKSLSKRVVSIRHRHEVPVKIWIEPDRNTGPLQMPTGSLSISGETKDLSKTGIAFIVPAIRIRENYLVGEGRTLNAELDLPNGKVQMKLVGQRYEQVGEHVSTARFLVGASISFMTDDNREAYDEFLRLGGKVKGARTGALELGIDEG